MDVIDELLRVVCIGCCTEDEIDHSSRQETPVLKQGNLRVA